MSYNYDPPDLQPGDPGYPLQQGRKARAAMRAARPLVDHNGKPLPMEKQSAAYKALVADNAKKQGA